MTEAARRAIDEVDAFDSRNPEVREQCLRVEAIEKLRAEAAEARPLKPVIWLLRRIEHVYDAKLVAEQADCREGLRPCSVGSG